MSVWRPNADAWHLAFASPALRIRVPTPTSIVGMHLLSVVAADGLR
jgi:hypothetical protein